MGDIEAPFKIYYSLGGIDSISLQLKTNKEITGKLNIEENKKISENDIYLCIDMRTHLIEGLNNSFEKNGTLYNKFIASGDFFDLPVDKNILTSNIPWHSIKFNYLYY